MHSIHKIIKGIEPYISTFFSLKSGGFGMAGIGAYFAWTNLIVELLGLPLSLMLGGGIGFWIWGMIRNSIQNRLNKNPGYTPVKKESEFTAEMLLDGLTDTFNPKDLAKKLSNRDIEKLADGTFERDKALFKFNQPRKIDVFQNWDKKNNKYEKDVNIISSAKEFHIGFEIKHNGTLINDAKVFVWINNEWKDLPRVVNEIIVPKADSNPLKFSIDANDQNIDEKQIKILVLIRSFSV